MPLKDLVAAKKYHREYYEKNKEADRIRKKAYNSAHKKEAAAYQKIYRSTHREEIRAYHKTYNALHGGEQRTYYSAYYCAHKPKINSDNKKNARDRRIKVLEHYSQSPPVCVCCGEREIKFLTLHHLNNDGAEHRRKMRGTGSGPSLWCWIIKNNYPPIFQVLCFNCNCAMGIYGECPHKKTENA